MIEMMCSFSIDDVSHSLTTSQGTRFCSQPNSSSPTPLPFEWLQVEGSAVRKVERWAIFVVIYIFAIEKVPHSLLLGDLASAPLLLPCTITISLFDWKSSAGSKEDSISCNATPALSDLTVVQCICRWFCVSFDSEFLRWGRWWYSKLDSNANWYMVLMQKSECKMQN